MTDPPLPPEDGTHPDHGPVLQVRNLSLYFSTSEGEIQILDDVSFEVGHRETVGLIGESGCGKSLTALSVLGLQPPTARVEGEILFKGRNLLDLDQQTLSSVRGREISMIFQEPMRSLDPVFTIGKQLTQVARAHADITVGQAEECATDMLDSVGIPDPRARLRDYPHQLSGGMLQRVLIAMALISNPQLLIADEPTTAVDVTIQAQLLDLIARLNIEREMAVLFISHDIAVIAETCEKVAVMYAGQVVEMTHTDTLLTRPAHPYASGLMWAVPRAASRGHRLAAIPGRVPASISETSGCLFRPRCSHATDGCEQTQTLTSAGNHGHMVRCWRSTDLDLPGAVDAHPSPGALGR